MYVCTHAYVHAHTSGGGGGAEEPTKADGAPALSLNGMRRSEKAEALERAERQGTKGRAT